MSERENLERILSECLSDVDAVCFCLSLWEVIHIWDDLYDQDKKVPKDTLNGVFTYLLVELPNNPFYVANQLRLRPMIESMILQWHSANAIEDGSVKVGNGHRKAYMLRAFYYQIVHYCGLLLHGWEYAQRNIGPFQSIYGEEWESYLESVGGDDHA